MKHLIPEFERLKARFPAGFESSLVLPCVRRIQEDRGFVADSDIDGLVEYLGVPRMQIEQVLSYYTQFRRAPIGRHHVQACRNITCSMRGAERLIDHLQRRLHHGDHQSRKAGAAADVEHARAAHVWQRRERVEQMMRDHALTLADGGQVVDAIPFFEEIEIPLERRNLRIGERQAKRGGGAPEFVRAVHAALFSG